VDLGRWSGSSDVVVGGAAGCSFNILVIWFRFLTSIVVKVQHGNTQ